MTNQLLNLTICGIAEFEPWEQARELIDLNPEERESKLEKISPFHKEKWIKAVRLWLQDYDEDKIDTRKFLKKFK